MVLAEFIPHGDAGVVQSPSPVSPTTVAAPVRGSIEYSLPENARLSIDLPGAGISPCPRSIGRSDPICTKTPLAGSATPNLAAPDTGSLVITYSIWVGANF